MPPISFCIYLEHKSYIFYWPEGSKDIGNFKLSLIDILMSNLRLIFFNALWEIALIKSIDNSTSMFCKKFVINEYNIFKMLVHSRVPRLRQSRVSNLLKYNVFSLNYYSTLKI